MNLSRKHDEKKNFISRGLQSSKYGTTVNSFILIACAKFRNAHCVGILGFYR